MASRSRASEYCSNTLWVWATVRYNKKKFFVTIWLVFRFMRATRGIFARKSARSGRATWRNMYVGKNSKVERGGKSRDKVNESHEESGLLIKTYGGSRVEWARGRFTRVKKLPARHRAISVARGRGRWLIFSPARSAKKPATESRTVRAGFREVELIQMRRDTFGHTLHS